MTGATWPAGESGNVDFRSPEGPERLLQWYRSPERDFRITSELQEGAEQVLTGTGKGGEFTVRLAPAPGGGTIGTVLVDED